VGATDTRQGEMTNEAQSEESWPISCQQGERVEDSLDTERENQQLQAGSNTFGEDSEGGLFANDTSSEGGIFESPHLLEVMDEEQ
jgi:hypothetical protein